MNIEREHPKIIFIYYLLIWHDMEISRGNFCIRGIVGKAQDAIQKYGLSWVKEKQREAERSSLYCMAFWNRIIEKEIDDQKIDSVEGFINAYEHYLKTGCHAFYIQYRCVLFDHPNGQPGGGSIESTYSYDELPKTKWVSDPHKAKRHGEHLKCSLAHTDYADFFIQLECKTEDLYTKSPYSDKPSCPRCGSIKIRCLHEDIGGWDTYIKKYDLECLHCRFIDRTICHEGTVGYPTEVSSCPYCSKGVKGMV